MSGVTFMSALARGTSPSMTRSAPRCLWACAMTISLPRCIVMAGLDVNLQKRHLWFFDTGPDRGFCDTNKKGGQVAAFFLSPKLAVALSCRRPCSPKES